MKGLKFNLCLVAVQQTIVCLNIFTSTYIIIFYAEALDMYYDKLVDSLPMKNDEFLAKFNEILPGDLKSNIVAQLTPVAGAICFLDNVVRERLDNGRSDNFELLLSTMEKFSDDNLKMLAKEIQHEITHKIEDLTQVKEDLAYEMVKTE